MTEYESSETILIADVDCIGEGKSLCEKVGVKGFPTIKYGDPTALQDYQGGRDVDALKSFAGDLKPLCNVATHEHCDDAQTKTITELKDLEIDELHEEKETIEKTFATGVQALQAKFEKLSKEKDISLGVLAKGANIGLVKSVIAHKKKSSNEEL